MTAEKPFPDTGKRCDCQLCVHWRHAREVIASRDVDRLIELVNELENAMCNVGEDLDYHEAVLGGSWPSSPLILAHALTRALERRAATGATE